MLKIDYFAVLLTSSFHWLHLPQMYFTKLWVYNNLFYLWCYLQWKDNYIMMHSFWFGLCIKAFRASIIATLNNKFLLKQNMFFDVYFFTYERFCIRKSSATTYIILFFFFQRICVYILICHCLLQSYNKTIPIFSK